MPRPLTVFLHSTGTTSALFARVPDAALLPDTERSHPGNLGYPPNMPVPRGSPCGLAADVSAHAHALRDAGDRPIHLVAHSYGATVALALAREIPIASLCLFEPVLFGALAVDIDEADAAAEATSFLADPAFLHDDATGGDEAWLRRFIDYWNRPGAFDAMPRQLRAGQVALGWKMYQEVRSVFFDVPGWPVVAPTTALTLAWGEQTTRGAAAMIRAMARRHPHARTHAMPDAGHMAPLTHPASAHAAIAAHFATQQT